MSGKLVTILILVCAVVVGAAIYYLQVYYFYETITPNGTDDVMLTAIGSDTPEAILYENFQAIDAESSPIRYRACFTTPMTLEAFSERYEPYQGASPRVAPGWFACFDAQAIGTTIQQGGARVFTGQRNLEFGIDRVVAITEDGRGYVWHELNDCGSKAYDGTPLGEDCPPRDGDK